MMLGSVSPAFVTVASRVARTEASASTSTCAPANFARSLARAHQAAKDRLQPVVVAVVQMVGLGGGEEDAVDARARRAGQPVGAPGRKEARTLGQRRFEVGDRAPVRR